MFYEKKQKKLNPTETKYISNTSSTDNTIDFINAGISCNCLVALSETEIFNSLIQNGFVSFYEIKKQINSECIRSALLTLESCGIVNGCVNGFEITSFGIKLCEKIGVIKLFFDGYSDLVSKQCSIIKNKIKNKKKLIKLKRIADAATFFSEKSIDPRVIQEISYLQVNGTICDLGCGLGRMLSKIYAELGNHGLGFEYNSKTVKQAQKEACNIPIEIENRDITNLHGVWEDVAVILQCHVFHDFIKNKKFTELMKSYKFNFPNHKYFLYIDSVSPEVGQKEACPGFDYVHGLLGISTPTYKETLNIFSKCEYIILKEIALDYPNTYLWVLVRNQ